MEEERSPFKRSDETQTLVKMFRDMKQGDVVTDYEIGALLGKDNYVRDKRHIVESARNITMDDEEVIIERITNTGYRRVVDHEVAKYQFHRKGHRSLRLGAKRSTYIKNWDKLTRDEQDSNLMTRSACLMGAAATGKNSEQKILEKVKQTGREIDLKDTMKLFYDS